MTAAPSHWLSLERLRRSTGLAAFALLVFVLRVGVVTACAPEDMAELVGMGDGTVLLVDGDHSTDADGDQADHAGGHCLHCSCHHAVALPASVPPLPALAMTSPANRPCLPQATAPPDLSLRPPIL